MVKANLHETDLDKSGGDFLSGDPETGYGAFHCIIKSAEEKTSKQGNPQLEVEIEALAGKPENMIGKTCKLFLPLTGAAASKFVTFMEAIGEITKDEAKEAQQNGLEAELDETTVPGKQICVEFKNGKPDKNTGAIQSEIGWRMYHIESQQAINIPKDVEAWEMATGKTYEAPGTKKPAATKPAAGKTATAKNTTSKPAGTTKPTQQTAPAAERPAKKKSVRDL